MPPMANEFSTSSAVLVWAEKSVRLILGYLVGGPMGLTQRVVGLAAPCIRKMTGHFLSRDTIFCSQDRS